MKPVYQTIFDFEHGNCMQACMASIFELPLEEVPNFNNPDSSHYGKNLDKWADGKGIKVVDITCDSDDDLDVIRDCWTVAVGPSPRGKSKKDRHAVVWYNGRMIHDPHPGKPGIKGKLEVYTIFIIKNPAKYKAIAG